ncbi:membrane-associated phospholipid phosphatase [Candidatus Scalindua japonica]|uniref:Membrane-associated phospholipid phosphatase n=2 Tax=Candidatus Scalindua japonica TaxID=1284222 RepID=A0A286U3T0_9BACT|nr:membrane-associated phospholipid phosphatase [Candidatus Scalindua japonica]
MVVVFATINRKYVLAGKAEHSFYLPSVFKEGSDVRSREILFTAEYPGDIEADASWEPEYKALTITLYNQEGKSLVSKKGKSPVHLVYTYTQEHFNKAKILGNSFRVGISQSPFKTINGRVKITTPNKKALEEHDSINIRGPYGTFIEEEAGE